MKVAIITSGKSFARKFCTKEETQNVWKAWHFLPHFYVKSILRVNLESNIE